MAEQRHLVRPGDCVTSLAARYGCTTQDIVDHADNEVLRADGADGALLEPGTELTIPASEGFSSEVSPAASHRFRGPRVARIRLRLTALVVDESPVSGGLERREERGEVVYEERAAPAGDDEALANAPYRLIVGGQERTGTTTGDGEIDEAVPAHAGHATLIVHPGEPNEARLTLRIGHLDPITTSTGVGQRLSNLGLLRGSPGDADAKRAALLAFQQKHDLAATGQFDDATREKLATVTR